MCHQRHSWCLHRIILLLLYVCTSCSIHGVKGCDLIGSNLLLHLNLVQIRIKWMDGILSRHKRMVLCYFCLLSVQNSGLWKENSIVICCYNVCGIFFSWINRIGDNSDQIVLFSVHKFSVIMSRHNTSWWHNLIWKICGQNIV